MRQDRFGYPGIMGLWGKLHGDLVVSHLMKMLTKTRGAGAMPLALRRDSDQRGQADVAGKAKRRPLYGQSSRLSTRERQFLTPETTLLELR